MMSRSFLSALLVLALLMSITSCESGIFGDGEHDYKRRVELTGAKQPLSVLQVAYKFNPNPDIILPDILGYARVAHWEATDGWLFETQEGAQAAVLDPALRESSSLKRIVGGSNSMHDIYWLLPEGPGKFVVSYLGVSSTGRYSVNDEEREQVLAEAMPPAGRTPITATVDLP